MRNPGAQHLIGVELGLPLCLSSRLVLQRYSLAVIVDLLLALFILGSLAMFHWNGRSLAAALRLLASWCRASVNGQYEGRISHYEQTVHRSREAAQRTNKWAAELGIRPS